MTQSKTKDNVSRGTQTREALLQSAINIFGRDGFASASTRVIAEDAGVNQALISYHFKSKKGLYLAAFEYINDVASQTINTHIEEIENKLETKNFDNAQDFYWHSIKRVLSRMLHMMNSAVTKDWSTLIIREQQHPTEAFAILRNGVLGKLHIILTKLIALQLGINEESERANLLAFTFIGQIIVFKMARASVLSHLQWERVGEQELALIEDVVFNNFSQLLNINPKSN